MALLKLKDNEGNVYTIPSLKGEDGKSAYEIALGNGFEGTEEEWLESLGGNNGMMLIEGGNANDITIAGIYLCSDVENLPDIVGGLGKTILFVQDNLYGGIVSQIVLFANNESSNFSIWYRFVDEFGAWSGWNCADSSGESGGELTEGSVEAEHLAPDIPLSTFVDDIGAAGGTELTEEAVQTEHIADEAVTPEKVSFITAKPVVGKNLYNKEDSTKGTLRNWGGVADDGNGYSSDYIAIDPQKTYCFAVHDYPAFTYMFGFYATDEEVASPTHFEYQGLKAKNQTHIGGFLVSYVVFGVGGDHPFDENAKFLRVWGNDNAMYNKNTQIEEGTVPTAFEPFGVSKYEYHLDENIKVGGTVEKEEEREETKPLSVAISDNTISLVGKFGDNQAIQIDGELECSSGNNLFNLHSRIISKDGVEQISDKAATDELPPISMNYGNVGANHSYYFVNIVFSGLVEIGQKITRVSDGTEFLCVDENVFVVACYEDANELWQKNDDGSTNEIIVGEVFQCGASELVVQANATFVRYKSTSHHKYSFIVDGKETTEHKNYNCYTFGIKETYDIISYKGLWDYYAIGENSGVSYDGAREDLPVCMTVENIYTFDDKCTMVVNTTFRAIEKIKITQAGIIQNFPLAKGADDLEYMYVNKAFLKNGVDLSTLVNIDDLPSNGVELKGTEFGESGVANRNVLWVKSASGEKKYGLTTGFIPDLSYSKDSNRKPLLGAIWQVYKTKKSYPYGVRVKTMDVGESLTCLAYRSYLPEETPVTNFNIVDIGNIAYLFIDAHESGAFTVEMDVKYHNRVIEVLEQSGIEVSSDVVGNTITFTVSGEYGYATLKLK